MRGCNKVTALAASRIMSRLMPPPAHKAQAFLTSLSQPFDVNGLSSGYSDLMMLIDDVKEHVQNCLNYSLYPSPTMELSLHSLLLLLVLGYRPKLRKSVEGILILSTTGIFFFSRHGQPEGP